MTDSNESELTVDDLVTAIDELSEKVDDTSEHESAEEAAERLDDIHDVADEVEDMLGTVDLTDLLSEIEWGNLPEAIELEDVPEAIEDRNPAAAVKLRKLLSVADMSEVWDNVNAREFWRQSRELDDELDDFSDEEDEGLLSGDEDDADDGLLDDPSFDSPFGDEEAADASDPADASAESGLGGLEGLGTDEEGLHRESMENAIQSRISDSVGEFRQSILAARQKLKKLHAENRRRNERRNSSSTDSRNPTAVSTMSPGGARQGTAKFSTVPEETRYSTAPNRRRIYGSRFEEAEDDA
ncbi:hypothetical protein KTS45_17760 [Halomicroarcula limicola]|uniref:Uncharacterized protein n=1 Tax=Haloarcula limicola TaxID=1429915 RepID=A0A8J8C6C0_9EURY|nr:hypothetical protein [Halomicroarcula limicola]MBV0926054.1 hypothetical protein [Halomicroarcula limicola]